MNEREIKEVYEEDTVGRKWRTPILTKKDGFNEKSVAKLHGECETFNFNAPISKKQFLRMSDGTKELYISTLRDKFGATNIDIANSMGWDNSSLGKELKRIGMPKKSIGYKKSDEQVIAWANFIKAPTAEAQTPEVQNADKKDCTTQGEKTINSNVSRFSFEQIGALDIDELNKRITCMIPNGTQCKITVQIETI